MSTEEQYTNNPLHGVGLEQVLNELVDHYGWDILYAYLNINCFKTNPSIASSVTFLKKTEWAREKVEIFYLYKLKGLPKPDIKNYELPPRKRIVPATDKPRKPAVLSLEDAEKVRERKAVASKNHNKGRSHRQKPTNNRASSAKKINRVESTPSNPWGKA